MEKRKSRGLILAWEVGSERVEWLREREGSKEGEVLRFLERREAREKPEKRKGKKEKFLREKLKEMRERSGFELEKHDS